jgi:hypothetical protein
VVIQVTMIKSFGLGPFSIKDIDNLLYKDITLVY